MYLTQLYGNFAEWRRLWNQSVLPYLRSQRLVAGHGIRISQRPAGTVIDVVDAGGRGTNLVGTADLYDSYFKLKLSVSAETGAHVLRIADGATDGNSVAVVNGYSVYTVPPYTETVSGDRLFFLKYRPAVYDSRGSVVTQAELSIGSVGPNGDGRLILPEGGTDGAFYTQLGRVLWHDGTPEAVQDFNAGAADVRWYVKC